MAENAVNKYLDLQGLQLLWQRIAEKYPRKEAVELLVSTLEGKHDGDINALNKRLLELEASVGSTMDGDTIIRNEDNQLQTNLMIDLDTENKKLRLVTKDTQSDVDKAKTVISEIDYTPFIKDGMLDSVSIVVVPDDETEQSSGKAPGTYLKFVFNVGPTGAGKEAIYLNVSEFINIYEGTDYIIIQDDKISLNVAKLDEHLEEYISTKSEYISGIVTRIDTAEQTIQSLQVSFGGLRSEFDVLSGQFNEVKAKVTQVEQTMLTYDARMNEIEETLETVPTIPISNDEINGLN